MAGCGHRSAKAAQVPGVGVGVRRCSGASARA